MTDPSSLEAAQAFYSRTNPWRDLPADQEQTVKEVLFIANTLRDTFLPISLPEEDDYTFLLALLRSLETRGDVSWTTLHETGVDRTLMAIANRPALVAQVEPPGLAARFSALHLHWNQLAGETTKPDRWEVRHDVTFLPPLVTDGSGGEAGLATLLSPEKAAQMEENYKSWRSGRDRKVSYLKLHPPTPLGWVPVSSAGGGEERAAAWADILDGGILRAGKQIAESALVRSPAWKPIYRDLLTERVPYDWQQPGEEMKEMTNEEYERWREISNRENAQRQERGAKQEALEQRLLQKDEPAAGKEEL